jgi:membrane-associated PAP2 superfamily phosphatase
MISGMLTQPRPESEHVARLAWRPDAWLSVMGALFLLAWDFSGGDMHMAQWWGQASGFALRDNWWMVKVMHEGARNAGWVLLLALLAGIWRPWAMLRRLAKDERVGLFLSVLAALLAITLIKGFSKTSCPWDLQAFGGLATYVSHWDFFQFDGGGGHCFPAGHASTGFAFMAAYFSLRHNGAPAARLWLVCALLAGFVLGISQQIRGAHFMSHTLWTAWICWTVGWTIHCLFQHIRGPKQKTPTS